MGVALLGGCTSTPVTSDQSFVFTSCVENARTLTFDLVYASSFVTGVTVTGTSSNVIGTPTLVTTGPLSLKVTAELDSVASGGTVTISLGAQVSQYGFAQANNIRFYTAPPAEIGEPDCDPHATLQFATSVDPAQGLVLEISNPTAEPIMLLSLDLAESPVLLSPPQLDWSDPDFQSLPWVGAMGGVVVAPGSPPIVVDLPETASPGTVAVLGRSVMQSAASLVRVIAEFDLINGTVTTHPATWGAVKALYQDSR